MAEEKTDVDVADIGKALAGAVPGPYGPLAILGVNVLLKIIDKAFQGDSPVAPKPITTTAPVAGGADIVQAIEKVAASIQRLAAAVEGHK